MDKIKYVHEELNKMCSWSIEDFDHNGAHIKTHFTTEEEVKRKVEEEGKKVGAIFLSKEMAENYIHLALSNPMIRRRVEMWYTVDKFIGKRLLVSYPVDECLGYGYRLTDGELKKFDCKVLTMVFMKDNAEEFYLYTAYPNNENFYKAL